MKRLTYGIHTHYSKSTVVSVYKLNSWHEHPEGHRVSEILPHTISASKLYKYLHNSSTTEYDVIDFRLIYKGVAYSTCLKRPNPQARKMIQDEWWPYMYADSRNDISSFRYDPERLIQPTESPIWKPTDIVYDE